jgi:putative alpha-1,2-mannosidase
VSAITLESCSQTDTIPSNEPDFATPYLYNYLNKQWKSVNQSRAQSRQ